MTANGWILRSGTGWPGVIGASFRPENVSFVEYPARAGDRLLRMTSSTDGSPENTYQTQVCHQRKYLEGTYAARVRFSDTPVSGADGDQIVQTFYAITPYDEPLSPDYSEMDNEYLPNGGWGGPELSFYVTTWETVQIEPWNARNTSTSTRGSQAGWRFPPGAGQEIEHALAEQEHSRNLDQCAQNADNEKFCRYHVKLTL